MTDKTVPRNLIGVEEDQQLWRVFDPEHIKTMFRDHKLTLVAPWKWTDPFEDFLARCKVKMPDGEIVGLNITDGFYGLCWTHAQAETDATWRIYAADPKRGVRVRVRAGNLFDCIYSSTDWGTAINCFLGQVEYKDEAEIRAWLSKRSVTDVLDGSNRVQAGTLLTKREAFRHEAEVRLLHQAHGSSRTNWLIAFGCRPDALVEDMLLDPRWTDRDVTAFTAAIQRLGYSGPIARSELYQVPDFDCLTF